MKTYALAVLWTAAFLTVLLGALAAFPHLDIAASKWIYTAQGGDFGARSISGLGALRVFGYLVPAVVMILAILAWVFSISLPGTGRLTGRGLLYLGLSFAIGPGLVVNGWLKDYSHRPRPAQIIKFGGKDVFQPWFSFDGDCETNCSFASGEASGAAWLVAPASLAPPPLRGPAMVAAGVFAAAVALLRMAFGGHFASDIIAGILATLASIVLCAWLIRPFQKDRNFDPRDRGA